MKARLVEWLTHGMACFMTLKVGASRRPSGLNAFPPVSAVAILVPHPDDEVIGCFHLINGLAGRVAVDLYYVTDGCANGLQKQPDLSKRRFAESERATAGLAIRKRVNWDLPDGNLQEYQDRLKGLLASLQGYELVLCPAPTDLTPDHAALAGATLSALGAGRLMWYRSTWLTFPLHAADFVATGELRVKKKALQHFATQRNLALGNVVTFAAVEAKACGLGCLSAEAFRWAKSGDLDWQPVNVLSVGTPEKLKEWYEDTANQ